MQFIPFSELKKYARVVAVDSYHPRAFMLSHWKGAPKPAGVPGGNTSTDWVLNTLQHQPQLLLNYQQVTNNHFDIDGFLGIWALMNPELALQQASLLRSMACISDFRELTLTSAEDYTALKLVCWLNQAELDFYPPFASYNAHNPDFRGQGEADWCVPKYQHFLPRFAAMLARPELGQASWQEEYERVIKHWQLGQAQARRHRQADIRLLEVDSPEPLHYYAQFSQSEDVDAVLSLYPENRYELEYKYTSWVDTLRISYPRLDLRVLARELNGREESPYRWQAEPITDTAPILRLTSDALTKEARYNHPYTRPIHSSSIEPEQFKQLVRRFFKAQLEGITPKRNWSWPEQRQVAYGQGENE